MFADSNARCSARRASGPSSVCAGDVCCCESPPPPAQKCAHCKLHNDAGGRWGDSPADGDCRRRRDSSPHCTPPGHCASRLQHASKSCSCSPHRPISFLKCCIRIPSHLHHARAALNNPTTAPPPRWHPAPLHPTTAPSPRSASQTISVAGDTPRDIRNASRHRSPTSCAESGARLQRPTRPTPPTPAD